MSSHGSVGESSRSRRGTAAKPPRYDRSITVFSTEGRVFQVDYARKYVKLEGITSVAMHGADSVCVITQRTKAPADPLLDTTDPAFMHLFQITKRIGMLATGMPGHGRALAQQARNEAAEFRYKCGYEMPHRMLAQWMGDTAQVRTQHAGMRPYRVVSTLVGIDEEKGTPELFTCDPPGQVLRLKATSVGLKDQEAIEFLEEEMAGNSSLPFQETIEDPLLDTTDPAFRHLLQITERLGMLAMGMPADGRALAEQARNKAAEFRYKWGYEMPPQMMAQWMGDTAQVRTQHAGMRPYRVVSTLVGIDEEKGTPELFTCDPAGQVLRHKATSVGLKDQEAIEFLEEEMAGNSSLTFQETIEDPLLDTTDPAFRHLLQITERLGMLATGMPADGRALPQQARNEAAEFRYKWGYEMPPKVMAQRMGDTAQVRTQHAGMRPYRVVATLVGIDEDKGTPELFTRDPAGQVLRHKATSAGRKEREFLKCLEEEMACCSLLFQATVVPNSHVCSKIPDEGMHSSIYMLSAKKSNRSAMKKTAWKLDSGTTFHATGNLSLLKNVRQAPKEWSSCCNASGSSLAFYSMGDVFEPEVRLNRVGYSKHLDEDDKLISISQLTSTGYAIQIGNSRFTIHDATNMNHILGNGELDTASVSYRVMFFNETVLQPKKRCKKESKGRKLQVVKDSFLLDSGCPHHLTNSKSNPHFKRKKTLTNVGFHTVGGGYLKATSKGQVSREGFLLKHVYDCETVQNLCSIPQLDLKGYCFLFIGDHCHITWKGEITGRAIKNKADDMLYYIEFFRAKD